MTTVEKTTAEPQVKAAPIDQEGRLDSFLSRLDLMAIFTAILGMCLLGVAAVVLAVIELAKIVAGLWTDSVDRWLIIVLGLAIVWIVARRKKLCVF
jgi:hypothetical protein